MIPWALYNLTPRDQAGPQIHPYNRKATFNIVAPSQTGVITFHVPDEHMMLVTAVYGHALSSAGNSPDRISFDYNGLDGANQWSKVIFNHYTATTIALEMECYGNPLLLVPAGGNLQFTFQHDLPTTADTFCQASLAGVVIPRGTIALAT